MPEPQIKASQRPERATSREEAKALICDIIAAAGGALRGKVRLHKAFYFAHLFYWRDGPGVLTSHPIVRAPHGPFIDDAERLIAELVQEGLITVHTVPVGPYEESVYHLVDDRGADWITPRGQAIRRAAEFVGSRGAVELSEMTHEFSVSWQNTENGAEMDIYLDVLPAAEIAAIRQRIEAVRAQGEW